MTFPKVLSSYASIALGFAAQYFLPPLLDGAHRAIDAIPDSSGVAGLIIKLVAGAALAGIGAKVLEKHDPNGGLTPSPTLPNDQDAATAKAAGAAASKGPFAK